MQADLPQEDCIAYFHRAGFTANGYRADRPQTPVLLVRGGVAPDRMSWTTTLSVTLSFAERSWGRLWATQAPPEAILAIIDHVRAGEEEYVIDPSMVESHEYDWEVEL